MLLCLSWQGYGQITRTTNIVVGASPFQDSMWTINMADYGILQRLAPTVPGSTVTGINGLAKDPTTGITYAILKLTGVSGRVLATIDIHTGVAAVVGNLGDNFATITFNANGSLFGVTGDGASVPETMYRIDKATAAKTLFRALGNGNDGEVIVYNTQNNFFYHWSGNGSQVFERFDTTGVDAIVNIPILTVTGGETFGALFLSDGNFLVSNISSDFRIWDTVGNASAPVATMPDDLRGLGSGTCTSSVAADGPLAFCSGDSVIFTVTGGTSYQWYVDGGSIAGATNASFKATARGRYNVVYTDSCGLSDSLATGFAVIVYPTPALTLPAVSNVCPGATVAFLPFSTATVFNFTGSSQNFVVPAGITSLTFDVIGAAGGQAGIGTFSPAGFGGRVQGTLNVAPGQLLSLNVGGIGGNGTSSAAAGGFNGGGMSGVGGLYAGGGGGGASDIRTGGTSFSERIIVAGGGAGNGFDGGFGVIAGGDGGNLTGANGASNPNPGTSAATGGSQVAGGNGATYVPFVPGANGSFGLGGDGGSDGISGGGGGGYYGGGGGAYSGGGGGSSFTDPLWVPSVSVTHTQGFNNGNGQITLTYSLTGTYNIIWGGPAAAAGFTNVTAAAIPSSPLSIAVPAGIPPGIYNGLINFNNGTCHSLDYAFSIVVNDTPAMDTPVNQSVCNGDATTTISFTSTVGGTTYTWTNDNTSIGLGAAGVGDISSFMGINTGTAPDTAHIMVTPHANGCSGTPVPFNIVVNPTPALSSPVSASICDSEAFVYVHTSATAGTTFTWSRDAVTGITAPAASGSGNINEVLDNATTDPIVVVYIDTLKANGCMNIEAVVVTVNPTPVLTSPLANGTQCDSSIFNYTSSSSTTGVTFSWSRAAIAGNPAASGTGATISEMLVNTTPLPVQITYVDSLHINGCVHTQNVTVTVNPTPVLSSADSAFACDSVMFHYAPASATPGTTFAWSRAAVTGISNPAASGVDSVDEILDNTTGSPIAVTYVYTLAANSCPPHEVTVTVIVNPTLMLSSPLIAPTICGNTLFSYVPTSGTSGVTFTWTRSGTTGISNPAASGTGIINETLVDTSDVKIPVTYVLTLHLNGCTNVQDVIDTVKPRPRLTSTLTPAAICDSSLFVYTPSSTLTGTTYSWDRPFVAGILSLGSSGTGGVSEILHNTTSGDKNVAYVYTLTADGCVRTQNVAVTVHPQATLGTSTGFSICSGEQFNYIPAPFGGSVSVTFKWVRPMLAGILPATTDTGSGPIHQVLTNTTSAPITVHYTYEITVAGSCVTYETISVEVRPAAAAPSITTKSPANVCKGTMYQNFGASAPGAFYTWSASNATVYATGTGNQYALISFPNSGTSVVRLTSYTSGCIGTDSFVVTVSATEAQTLSAIYVRGQFVALSTEVDSYQWGYDDATSLDSVIAPGAIDQSFIPLSFDFAHKYYWVMTTHGDCLQKTYVNSPVGVTNINDAATAEVRIYPNPAGEYVNVEVSKGVTGSIQVEVLNVLGQKLDMQTAVDNMARIDVAKFVPGAYLVNCYNNGVKIASARFIKN